MSSRKFGRVARCGLFAVGLFALSACGKKEEPAPPPAPAPAPAPDPKPRPTAGGMGGMGAKFDPLGGFFGSGPTAEQSQALKKKHEERLVGTWAADHGEGVTEELTYGADGTYSAKLTGPEPATAAGKYAVVQAVGTRALKLQLGDDPGGRTITVSFDGDALEHPSLRPGVTGTFRKK